MKRIICVLIVLICALSLLSCTQNRSDLGAEDIQAICELATIKCYYNNVAQVEKEKENIFQKKRKLWIEYEGEAVIGINMAEVTIEVDDEVVEITMPKAKILSIKPVDETLNQKSYVASEDGFLFKNKVTTKDQNDAVDKGQEEMRKAVSENADLFLRAENKAKELIENYVNSVSEFSGVEYTIVWKQAKESKK